MTKEELGKKIVIVGVSASGKTTFGQKLAEKLQLPLTRTDAIMWKPNWEYVGDEKINTAVLKVSQNEKWIIEGYITKGSRTVLFERADVIIHLDYPGWFSAQRYIKRWWKHRTEPREELAGSPESFSFKFLWLVFTKGEAVSLAKFLNKVDDQNKIVTLRSAEETQKFLEKI